MDDTTILGATLGQLGQTVKQGVKQVVKMPEEMAEDIGGQVGGAQKPASSAASNAASGEPRKNKPQQQWQSDEERVKFLRDIYGSAQPSPEATAGKANSQANKTDSQTLKDKKLTEFEEQIKDKSPEEQKKLLELRNQLHKENYYDPTFNPKNPPAGGEERPAEKMENEKKKEMQDLQQKEEKKPPPLAVVREQNKTEQFRGVSG